MARMLGVTLPDEKRIDYALTTLYGIGWTNVKGVLKQTGVAANKKVKEVTEEEIVAAMEKFKGEIQQVPPMYSAIKKMGKPLYRYARAHQEVERAPRQIHIFEFKFLGKIGDEVQFQVHCSKGTYVRTLCADVGKELGSGACVKELKRIRTGSCELRHAIGLEELSLENLTVAPHWKTIAEIRPLCYKAL